MSHAQRAKARISVLTARESSKAVIFRRRPSNLWRVLTWDTATDEIVAGSWHRGTLYPEKADLAPDGRWLVYCAYGSLQSPWVAVCRPPSLHGLLWRRELSSYAGAGLWRSNRLLSVWTYEADEAWRHSTRLRVDAEALADEVAIDVSIGPEVEGERMRARGFVTDGGAAEVWRKRPTPAHPALEACRDGNDWNFRLVDGHSALEGEVTSVDWDCLGQLIVARPGMIERWSLDDLALGEPGYRLSLDDMPDPEDESAFDSVPG